MLPLKGYRSIAPNPPYIFAMLRANPLAHWKKKKIPPRAKFRLFDPPHIFFFFSGLERGAASYEKGGFMGDGF